MNSNNTDTYTYNEKKNVPRDVTAVFIPPNITWIDPEAFRRCQRLATITVPSTVTLIGNGAFCECSSLSAIELPTTITTIGNWAFHGCESLTSINLPTSITSIGWHAFNECSSLNTATIPPNIDFIAASTFANCTSLASVSFTAPSSLTEIEGSAFTGCRSLTKIDLPSSIEYLGDFAFESCTSLSTVNISSTITLISENTFRNCPSLVTITTSPNFRCVAVAKEGINTFGTNPTHTHIFLDHLCSNDSTHVYTSEISQNLIDIVGINLDSEYIDRLYINWNVCATIKNTNNGRLPLFAAAEANLNLVNGLGHILHANGAAIEDVDPVTGLEAFMLAAVGSNSKLESVYTLLQDYPGAINSYVSMESNSSPICRKRKLSSC